MTTKFSPHDLFCGTLCQIRKPHGKVFWHLTWKSGDRTVTRYVRLDEVSRIKKGIAAYHRAKAELQRIASRNLSKLMAGRKYDH